MHHHRRECVVTISAFREPAAGAGALAGACHPVEGMQGVWGPPHDVRALVVAKTPGSGTTGEHALWIRGTVRTAAPRQAVT